LGDSSTLPKILVEAKTMAVAIVLEPYGQTFVLPREFIQTYLPGSLFAETLEVDPTANRIPIPNPIVTPAVMQFLVEYNQGREPHNHIPDLIDASRYLNIPWMLYYADPLYDKISDRMDLNSPENQDVLEEAIREDHVWIVGYFLAKGMPPNYNMVQAAVVARAPQVLALLLDKAELTPEDLSNLLELAVQWINEKKPWLYGADCLMSKGAPVSQTAYFLAVRSDEPELLKILLKPLHLETYVYGSNAETDKILLEALIDTTEWGNFKILDYLLTQTPVPPSADENATMRALLDPYHNKENLEAMADRLWSDPRFDQNLGNIVQESLHSRSMAIFHRLMNDARVDLTPELIQQLMRTALWNKQDDTLNSVDYDEVITTLQHRQQELNN
jgi:hypothetical protein